MGNKRKKTLVIVLTIFAITLVIGATYAFVTRTLTGTKKVTLTAGTLSLVLDEKNAITISDALPMYDQVGMIQEEVFEFDLINNTSNPTDYTLKLQKVSTANELSTSDVKYYLTKDGVGQPALLSTLTDGVVDTGTITGGDTINYTLRLWISDTVTEKEAIEGKSLIYKLAVEASMTDSSDDVPTTVTFAGITKEVSETTETMFNYTSEGIDPMGGDSVAPTNGIYATEDDVGPSYFYRGEVNNLVKFGSYTKDYYVYRYSNYDFPSLEACKYYDSSCSEANKIIKYKASDNVPMYWRIVRVNGDGTIRMIYAGTSPEAEGQELGIGLSRYNQEFNDPKYAGYTYDKTSTEVKSDAKEEIDTWYSNVLEGTTYDSKIATGKFCSDSSGYEYDAIVTQMKGSEAYTFEGFRRNFANMFGTGNSSPSFKCSTTTDVNFGGSYNLKAGLMTLDEVVAAGSQTAGNTSSYLYDTKGFWTMSPPAVFNDGYALVAISVNGGAGSAYVYDDCVSLRPVINLRADVVFKEGTDGSTLTPYELVE